jgi:hypothetical protein
MIATIRDLGMYPCIRCLILKDEIPKLGMEEDRQTRERLRRVDSVERQARVEGARKNLYENGYAITADCVDGILKDGSLIPTKVGRLHHTLRR